MKRKSPKSSIVKPPSASFIFFAGKGGVGKTTCAAAWALAQARAGRRVLLVSTDPAHSLGDVLGTPLNARVTPCASLAGKGWVGAAEIDARAAFRRWLREHRRALADIVEHGTWLDRADADALLDLSVPGVDELMGMLEILRLSRATRLTYDLVVVDTAPTGHTLRLFGAPRTVADVAGVLDRLEDRHRIVREQFARSFSPQAADRLIAALEAQAAEAMALLTDALRASVAWVTLPEMLAYAESVRAIGELRLARIAVSEIIVNRLTPAGGRCRICDPRRASEQRVVSRLSAFGRGMPIRQVRAAPTEPRGSRALSVLARELGQERGVRRVPAGRRRLPAMAIASDPSSAAAKVSALAAVSSLAAARLVFVAGKGGVGKTTVAAAIAARLARDGQRVLLLSTDPAHSIEDVLGVKVTERAAAVRGGGGTLFTQAVDAAAAFSRHREELERAFAQLADIESGLSSLAPPGIDELFGLLSLVDHATGERRYGTLVVDTAPTGHALRLLETPEVTRAWLQTLMRMLLKYRNVVGLGALAEELLRLSKSIGRLQELLQEPSATRFVVVTRAAAVPRLETRRLVNRLSDLRLSLHALIVNARTLSAGACRVCASSARNERGELRAIERFLARGSGCAIIQTPLASPPPRGLRDLERWSGHWIQTDGAKS